MGDYAYKTQNIANWITLSEDKLHRLLKEIAEETISVSNNMNYALNTVNKTTENNKTGSEVANNTKTKLKLSLAVTSKKPHHICTY